MTTEEIKAWLNGEIENYPDRSDAEDLYAYMIRLVDRILPIYRSELIAVLKDWIQLHTPTKTNLVLEITHIYHLTELREDLERLLNDVKDGRVFKNYYYKDIERVLKKLS